MHSRQGEKIQGISLCKMEIQWEEHSMLVYQAGVKWSQINRGDWKNQGKVQGNGKLCRTSWEPKITTDSRKPRVSGGRVFLIWWGEEAEKIEDCAVRIFGLMCSQWGQFFHIPSVSVLVKGDLRSSATQALWMEQCMYSSMCLHVCSYKSKEHTVFKIQFRGNILILGCSWKIVT